MSKEHELITETESFLRERGFHVDKTVAKPSPDLKVMAGGKVTHITFTAPR